MSEVWFSQRKALEREFNEWADENNAAKSPFNAITWMVAIKKHEPDVRHGYWIEVRDRWGSCVGEKCSECGRRVKNGGENYCPKCGSKNGRLI